ncbi:MAG: PIN domain-containing protein [Rubrobacter sp.]|nr:PIN domain-containing protein [Rubrobacter sp.]
MASEPVLVDTSFWIEFFNRPDSEEAASVEAVIREDRAALTGVVLAELLRGARTEEEASRLQAALGAVAWVEVTRSVYARAGRLGFELRRRGVTLPVTDCIVAASAETIGGRILTLDGHFEELARVATLTVLAG